MATVQVNNIRKQRELDIVDSKALAARKMARIRKIRDREIKAIKEKAYTQIHGLSRQENEKESSLKKPPHIKRKIGISRLKMKRLKRPNLNNTVKRTRLATTSTI